MNSVFFAGKLKESVWSGLVRSCWDGFGNMPITSGDLGNCGCISSREPVVMRKTKEGTKCTDSTGIYPIHTYIYIYLERRMNTFFCAKAVFGQNLSYGHFN